MKKLILRWLVCFLRGHLWPWHKPEAMSWKEHLDMLLAEKFPCARCGLRWCDRR